MLQIAETRLLSVISWYYLAFFAISMAMFGMTARVAVCLFQPRLFPAERLFEHLAWIGVALAVAIGASLISLVSSLRVEVFCNSTLADWPDGRLTYTAHLHCGSNPKLHHERGR
jgi:hypothetical protein